MEPPNPAFFRGFVANEANTPAPLIIMPRGAREAGFPRTAPTCTPRQTIPGLSDGERNHGSRHCRRTSRAGNPPPVGTAQSTGSHRSFKDERGHQATDRPVHGCEQCHGRQTNAAPDQNTRRLNGTLFQRARRRRCRNCHPGSSLLAFWSAPVGSVPGPWVGPEVVAKRFDHVGRWRLVPQPRKTSQ